jgi:hypothetical protein
MKFITAQSQIEIVFEINSFLFKKIMRLLHPNFFNTLIYYSNLSYASKNQIAETW